ncbi:hypothetical protein Fmac_028187 [Flemingia macrophylla]|uniref:Uncharacterized protein n=1 Tax=Flemingia macrophylla TaxID=520843 RepID=A0ABD1L788_9FABA
MTNLVLKTPKGIVELGELNVDISKDGESEPNLLVRVQILPIIVHIAEAQVSRNQLSDSSGGEHNA